jgi:type IV pilus assembly protein PilN
MIRINLLPFRAARKKENIRRQVSVFLLSLILVLLAFFYFNFSLASKIDKLHSEINTATTELKKYNEINAEIEKIKKTLENLNQKMVVIETLEHNRFAAVRLLDEMTQVVVPQRMWFTHLDDKDKTVKIDGIALDNKTVADFMVRLQGCGLFSSVNLKTLKQKEVLNNNLKSFQITCEKVSMEKPAKQPDQKKAST